jgi:nucleotide-binding universal stress UspA family protein
MRAVIAFDGSESAYAALDLGASLAWPAGSEVRLLWVVPHQVELNAMYGAWPVPETANVDLESVMAAESLRALNDVSGRFERPGLAVSCSVLTGHAAEAVCTDAASFGAKLIIVGSRGHGILASALLGSVSAAIVDHSPCPVLVARTNSVRRILLGVDGSPAAGVACDIVSSSLFSGAAVSAIAVADTRMPWWVGLPAMARTEITPALADAAQAARATASLRAQWAKEAAEAASCQVSAEVREGDPASVLIAAAEAGDIDLIALGSRGYTGLRRMALGSVARAILLHAHCSVLIAHAPKVATAGIGSGSAPEAVMAAPV